MFFFKNHAENKVRRLVPDLFLFLKTALYKVKVSGQRVSLNPKTTRGSIWLPPCGFSENVSSK